MLFPIFIDLSGKEILVVGGGTIAARRVNTLLSFGANITVVAPGIGEMLKKLGEEKKIQIHRREFRSEDLLERDMVLAATNQYDLNQEIYFQCKARNILVNVCSDQTMCDFQFPSVVYQEPIVVGINASGKDHRLVKETRQKIERCLGVQNESIYKE